MEKYFPSEAMIVTTTGRSMEHKVHVRYTLNKFHLCNTFFKKKKHGKGFESTFRDGKDHEASNTPKEQKACLSYFPSKVLNQKQTAQDCRNFDNSKDELCEVEIQAKTTSIQGQSII